MPKKTSAGSSARRIKPPASATRDAEKIEKLQKDAEHSHLVSQRRTQLNTHYEKTKGWVAKTPAAAQGVINHEGYSGK